MEVLCSKCNQKATYIFTLGIREIYKCFDCENVFFRIIIQRMESRKEVKRLLVDRITKGNTTFAQYSFGRLGSNIWDGGEYGRKEAILEGFKKYGLPFEIGTVSTNFIIDTEKIVDNIIEGIIDGFDEESEERLLKSLTEEAENELQCELDRVSNIEMIDKI